MQRYLGFTLVELLITVAILAIITAVAYPAYSGYMQKARRTEAIQTLYSMQLAQEDWRISNPGYTSSVADLKSPASTNHYDFSATVADNSYTLTATARKSQQNDKEGGTSCSTLTLARNGDKTPAVCW